MPDNLFLRKSQRTGAAANRRSARRPGRPARSETIQISKDAIIEAALNLSRNEPLEEISVVRMAHAFAVTPGLIHYYLSSRNALTSGVMNAFFRKLVRRLPLPGDDWRNDIMETANAMYSAYAEYRGVASYLLSHNRYRLIQDVDANETDFGLVFFDRISGCVRQAQLGPRQTAVFVHLLLQHVLISARQQSGHQLPGDHQKFLMSNVNADVLKSLPNARFIWQSFTALRGETAFVAGLELIVRGIERSRAAHPDILARARSRKRSEARPTSTVT